MPPYLPIGIGVAVIAFVIWTVMSQRKKAAAEAESLARLGFRPCPEKAVWLRETVVALENDRQHEYSIEKAQWIEGSPPIYHYTKRRETTGEDETPYAEEELLFALRPPLRAAVVLIVKPSSMAPGLATRMIGSVATGPWDTQPDDLVKMDLPAELKETNLLGVLGPKGSALYDLVDQASLGAYQGIGDAGGMQIRVRGGWCSISRTSHQIPFQVGRIIERMRPLL